MIEIRLHGRGGQGLVKASHMAVASVVESGDYAHFIPSFGVERKGSPVFGYLRVSREPIRRKTQIYHPDILVILDDTLIHLPETYDGLKKGGIVVINSTKKPEELNLPEGTGKVAIVDATRICLESFGRFIPNTAMLGGGIGVCAIRDGRMVDAPDGLEGEGPFSNNRCCTVPVGRLVKLCYSGQYTEEEMIRHINGEAGLMAYLGTTDIRQIMKDIENGDTYAEQVMDAMCYQTAKEIGAMATVLEGRVDAILLIGGMANVDFICEHIRKRVEFIAPVVILPGEREMEALAEGAYLALTRAIPLMQFEPKEET